MRQNSCSFCERISHLSRDRDLVPPGSIAFAGHLMFGADRNNRPYIYGKGRDTSDIFYPRYCPICGKHLDEIFPAPDGENEFAFRDLYENNSADEF